MKKTLFTLLLAALLAVPAICSGQETTQNRSLNEIRFDGWTEDDWHDNDYIRTLRTYLNKCCKDATSEQRAVLQSKFVILSIQPALLGGVSILFSFLEAAELVFQAHVYSEVDEIEEKVVDYMVYSVQVCDEESGFTKEDYLKIAAENSKVKFW